MSVIIPVLNGSRTLPACLDALCAQEAAPAFEVIVVDNGSADGTVEIASAHVIGARVEHEPRRGSYAARNRGIGVARGEIIAFTDADCVPAPGWLAAGAARSATGADLVGGTVEQVAERPNRWELYDSRHYLRQAMYVERYGFAATANLFVSRTVLTAIGSFDAALASHGDAELCHRATARGYTLEFEPAAVVRHRPRSSPSELWRLHSRLGAGWETLRRMHPTSAERFEAGGRSWTVSPQRGAHGDAAPKWRRRLNLLPAYIVARSARTVGRLSARGRIGSRRHG